MTPPQPSSPLQRYLQTHWWSGDRDVARERGCTIEDVRWAKQALLDRPTEPTEHWTVAQLVYCYDHFGETNVDLGTALGLSVTSIARMRGHLERLAYEAGNAWGSGVQK